MAMCKKVRKDNSTINMCSDNFSGGVWRDDQEVQRLAGIWNKGMKDALIETACNGEYVPPIILAEEPCDNGTCEVWLVDGLQRLSTFVSFRNDQYKITKSFKGTVTYSVEEKDENGRFIYDENNHKVSHIETCSLGGKYYSNLPTEVKRMFDQCSLDLVFHQGCTKLEISKLVAKYNNHKAMNSNQIAFTLIPNYARKVRTVTEESNCIQDYIMPNLTPTKQIDGTLERMVIEMCCLLCHPNEIATDFKTMARNMNNVNNGNKSYEYVMEVLDDLSEVFDEYPEVAKYYTSKNGAINVKVFDYHRNLGVDDKYFADFMMGFDWEWLDSEMKKTNANRTKSVSKIHKKIEILIAAYRKYLEDNGVATEEVIISDNNATENTVEETLEFIHNNVSTNPNEEDIELYEETLEDLTVEIESDNPLLEHKNHLSLIGMVAYSYVKDVDIDKWIIDYSKRITETDNNPENNYMKMLTDFKNYSSGRGVA